MVLSPDTITEPRFHHSQPTKRLTDITRVNECIKPYELTDQYSRNMYKDVWEMFI